VAERERYYPLLATFSISVLTHSVVGSGKSVLRYVSKIAKVPTSDSVCSASVIENLRNSYDCDSRTALAFFYFSFAENEKQDAMGMLSSIIKQLCCRRSDTLSYIELLRQYQQKEQRPDMKTLKNILLAAAHGFEHVYLVLDALDECSFDSGARRTLLDTICRIVEKKSENLHLFLTSRREVDIDMMLKPLVSSSPADRSKFDINLSLFQQALELDIHLHVNQKFTIEHFRSLPDDVKDEARSTLIKNADGM
jgi:hypothetical protein